MEPNNIRFKRLFQYDTAEEIAEELKMKEDMDKRVKMDKKATGNS